MLENYYVKPSTVDRVPLPLESAFRALLSICAANVGSQKAPFAITVVTWTSLRSTSVELASLLSVSCPRQFWRLSLFSTGRGWLPVHA
jgi:hypothetical protein